MADGNGTRFGAQWEKTMKVQLVFRLLNAPKSESERERTVIWTRAGNYPLGDMYGPLCKMEYSCSIGFDFVQIESDRAGTLLLHRRNHFGFHSPLKSKLCCLCKWTVPTAAKFISRDRKLIGFHCPFRTGFPKLARARARRAGPG